jgi:hypothetical protein
MQYIKVRRHVVWKKEPLQSFGFEVTVTSLVRNFNSGGGTSARYRTWCIHFPFEPPVERHHPSTARGLAVNMIEEGFLYP